MFQPQMNQLGTKVIPHERPSENPCVAFKAVN